MTLLPQSNDTLDVDFEVREEPSYTYRIIGNRISGFIDNVDALKQAIFKMLSTTRYEHLIYSWDYGTELTYLIGQPSDTSILAIKTNITESLLTDTRILDVTDFEFEINKSSITCSFIVNSIYGEFKESTVI